MVVFFAGQLDSWASLFLPSLPATTTKNAHAAPTHCATAIACVAARACCPAPPSLLHRMVVMMS